MAYSNIDAKLAALPRAFLPLQYFTTMNKLDVGSYVINLHIKLLKISFEKKPSQNARNILSCKFYSATSAKQRKACYFHYHKQDYLVPEPSSAGPSQSEQK